MMLLFVFLFVLVFVLFWLETKDKIKSLENRLMLLRSAITEDVTTVADVVDANQDLNSGSIKNLSSTTSTLDTKIHALAAASGYELVNGLWQKQKPVRKPPTKATVLRGAAPTAAKKATKGGK